MQQNRLERQLKAVLQRECPPPHDLGEYDMGLLPPSAMMVIDEHVRSCPHCQAELQVLHQFLQSAEPTAVTALIERVVEWGKDLLSGAGHGALAGVRGPAGRARTFEIGELWISITFQERPDGLRDLLALVMRTDGASVQAGTVTLLLEGKDDRTVSVDAGGNAVLTAVPTRGCDLVIEAEGERIRIRGVSG
jgi:hypothetical protein